MGLRDLSLVSCLVWFTVRADAILTDNLIYLTSSMSVYAVNERGLSCGILCAMGKTVVIGCRGKYIRLFIIVLGCDISSFWSFSDTSSFVHLTAVVSGISQLKCIFVKLQDILLCLLHLVSLKTAT